MAELLAPYAGHAADYPAWLSWITRFGNLCKSRALFELVLAAIRRGDYQDIEHTLWVPPTAWASAARPGQLNCSLPTSLTGHTPWTSMTWGTLSPCAQPSMSR